jgi:hypothetical protein
MKRKTQTSNLDFKMVVESEDTIALKRVYPENMSAEEIANIEKNSREVTLHCFDRELIDELYQIGKKIALRNHKMYEAAKKKRSFMSILKYLFAKHHWDC